MKKYLRIILISAVLSLAITAGWFRYEGYCAKEKGRLPISHTIYGGEWMGEEGLFWTIGITVPLTDINDPNPTPSTTDVSYSPNSVAMGFIAFWVIGFLCLSLTLQKKERKKVWIGLAALIAIVASILGGTAFVKDKINDYHRQTLIKSRYKDANTLVSLTVSTAALNNEDIVTLSFPMTVNKLQISDGNGFGSVGSSPMSANGKLILKEISKRDLKKLIKLLEQIETDPTANQNGDFSYYCELVYKDSDARSQTITIYGSDDFPSCWPKFAKFTNKLCEREILVENPELIVCTPDWFKTAFHVEDSDLPEDGSVEDMLSSLEIDMRVITKRHPVFRVQNLITEYAEYLREKAAE